MKRAKSRRAEPLRRGDRVYSVYWPQRKGTVDEAGPEQTMVRWDRTQSKMAWCEMTRDLRRVE